MVAAEAINKNITEINAVADLAESAVQGTATVSEGLAQQAIDMRRLAERFRG